MAIKKLYSILDTKAQAFLNPISFATDGEAIRWLTTEVDGDAVRSNVARYPEDFILYRLHDFDDQLGITLNTMDGKEHKGPKELIAAFTLKREVSETKYTVEQSHVVCIE